MPWCNPSWTTVVLYCTAILLLTSCKGCKILLQSWYFNKKKLQGATECLKELHWLPISARIKFKILLLTFRAQRLEQPVYISQLLAPYVPPRDLRSSDKAYLSLPNPRLKAYGYRCFAYSAPYLWNQLPDHIRFCTELSVFKSYLKTHIFTCSFDCNWVIHIC